MHNLFHDPDDLRLTDEYQLVDDHLTYRGPLEGFTSQSLAVALIPDRLPRHEQEEILQRLYDAV